MTDRATTSKSADAYRTISEVAEALKLPQHVLRFWETRFPQVKPLKRGGGRRFYRPEDVELLRAVKTLLYGDGYTIKGVQRILREQGPRAVAALAIAGERATPRTAEGDRGGEALKRDDHGQATAPKSQPASQHLSSPVSEVHPAPHPPAAEGEPRQPLRPGPVGTVAPDASRFVQGLEAVLFDLLECGRVLAAAKVSRD